MKTKTALIFVYLLVCLCRVLGAEPAKDSASLAQLIDRTVDEYASRKLTREQLDARFPDDTIICALPETSIYGADLKLTVISLCSLGSPRGPVKIKAVCSFTDSKGELHRFHISDAGRKNEANQPLQGTPGKVPSSSTEPEARRP